MGEVDGLLDTDDPVDVDVPVAVDADAVSEMALTTQEIQALGSSMVVRIGGADVGARSGVGTAAVVAASPSHSRSVLVAVVLAAAPFIFGGVRVGDGVVVGVGGGVVVRGGDGGIGGLGRFVELLFTTTFSHSSSIRIARSHSTCKGDAMGSIRGGSSVSKSPIGIVGVVVTVIISSASSSPSATLSLF